MTGVNQPWSGRKLHFVGIGGVGMSGLAKVARILGADVTGSDRAQDGHAASNVPAGAEVVYSSAIPADNPRGFTDEEHDLYQRSFTTAVLEAASGNVRALHVHGNHLVMSRIAGYPYEILSISDRLGGNPTLAELRKITDKCLMGGLDETRIQDMSLPSLDEQIDDAVAQAGPTGLILAPGCTIPSFTHQRNLAHIREYSRAVRTAA